jgi:hypothetical protein
MLSVKDANRLYELSFDSSRHIAYEKSIGFWKKEDLARYHDEYTKNLPMDFRGKPWAICCDLRDYKTSSISEEMQAHTQWKLSMGLKCGAIIVNDPIVIMQMNRAIDSKCPQKAFSSMEEADKWLRSQGF